jgi:threonine dehydrogenase-like Zn-dependent dehydrogenase
MKQAVTYGPGEIAVADAADPTPGPNEVVLRVTAAGICGSDLHFHRRPPGGECTCRALGGHEFCGRVTAVGEGVTHVGPGDRVGVEPLLGCGGCRFCAAGHYHLCPGLKHLSGGFSELAKAPSDKVFRIPDNVSDDAAAILDCLACGVHAMQRYAPDFTDTAVVLGDAAIGLSTLGVAKANGAGQVGVIGHPAHAMEIARRLGADFAINSHEQDPIAAVRDLTGGIGADVVYESVGGTASTLVEAAQLVRPGGTIVVIGCFTDAPSPDWRRLMRYEVNVLFSWSYARWNGIPEYQLALDLLAARKVDAAAMVTHHFPLDQVDHAFAAALRKGDSKATKVLVTP